LTFTDGRNVFDLGSTTAQVYLPYDSVLGRTCDLGNLRSWTGAIENGALTLSQTIDGFTGSAEFQMKFSALDDMSFVCQLYRNVLGHDGKESGL
jgi:hypothetical protein